MNNQMNNRLEPTLSLIGQIYDAALQPELWPAFATQFCQVVPSDDFNIHSTNTLTGKQNLAYTTAPPEAMQRYFTTYHALNPYTQRSFHLLKTGSLFRSHEFCPPEEFEQTEFYRDYFRELNLFHALVMSVWHEADLASSVGMARSRERGIYTAEEAELMRTLLPHLQRAFRIGNMLADLTLERDMLSKTLDKLPQGALVINEIGYPIFMNESAKQMLARQDGLSLDRQGKLQVSQRPAAVALQQMIHSASQPYDALKQDCGGALQIERPSGLRAYALMIAPLNLELSQLNYQQAAAMIFITDPEMQAEVPTDMLQRLYGLTPAEAKLAALLAHGKSVTEAAEELHVTQNTARTHLKHIFQKTGVKRQSELVKLILNSPVVMK